LEYAEYRTGNDHTEHISCNVHIITVTGTIDLMDFTVS